MRLSFSHIVGRTAAIAGLVSLCYGRGPNAVLAPIRIADRRNPALIALTQIGLFGLPRKARPGIPEHLHTGIDMKRPGNNYVDEPIYPASEGVVVSVRDDGPFAQIIIEHPNSAEPNFWTVYEHIAGIRCEIGDTVVPEEPIARFLSREELGTMGWQFDHLHFEVLHARPLPAEPTERLPQRHLGTYALVCFTREQLLGRYCDPLSCIGGTVDNCLAQ